MSRARRARATSCDLISCPPQHLFYLRPICERLETDTPRIGLYNHILVNPCTSHQEIESESGAPLHHLRLVCCLKLLALGLLLVGTD
jgi:hypothetical protein